MREFTILTDDKLDDALSGGANVFEPGGTDIDYLRSCLEKENSFQSLLTNASYVSSF